MSAFGDHKSTVVTFIIIAPRLRWGVLCGVQGRSNAARRERLIGKPCTSPKYLVRASLFRYHTQALRQAITTTTQPTNGGAAARAQVVRGWQHEEDQMANLIPFIAETQQHGPRCVFWCCSSFPLQCSPSLHPAPTTAQSKPHTCQSESPTNTVRDQNTNRNTSRQ